MDFDNYEIQNILINAKKITKNQLHTYANSRNTDFMLFVYTSNREDPGYKL